MLQSHVNSLSTTLSRNIQVELSNLKFMTGRKKNTILQYYFRKRENDAFFPYFRFQMRAASRQGMIFINSEYFRLNRILLLTIGLWPYERTRLVKLQMIFIFGLLLSNVTYQFATLVFTKCTPSLVINVLSIALYFSTFVITYYYIGINASKIRMLLDILQQICNDIKDENEIAIITKYRNTAKRLTTIFILFHVSNVATCLLLTCVMHFFDTVLREDESQSNRAMQKIIPKFYIGQENYTYLILSNFMGSVCIGGTVLVGTGTMALTYIEYVCGICKVASYRIEKAIMINMLKNEISAYKELSLAVDIHRKGVKFITLAFSNFKELIFLLLTIKVLCLSFNLYRISEAISHGGEIEQCYFHLIITIAIFVFLFVTNYAGQEVTDYNSHVFYTAYKVRWYVAPLHIQKLILFLLQNGTKTFHLSIGGIYTLSNELFAMLTKASISYFTVVYSMQQ